VADGLVEALDGGRSYRLPVTRSSAST
jgi:hypothetical protein